MQIYKKLINEIMVAIKTIFIMFCIFVVVFCFAYFAMPCNIQSKIDKALGFGGFVCEPKIFKSKSEKGK